MREAVFATERKRRRKRKKRRLPALRAPIELVGALGVTLGLE